MKIGVDLGGTKIEVIVLDKKGRDIWRKRAATPQNDYQLTLNAIKHLVSQARVACSLAKKLPVGIGTPGALFFEPSLGRLVLRNSNTTTLNGRPFLDDLKACLACDVYLENDANCFALAEALSGKGLELDKIPDSVFGVILGTGVGGGVVIGHQVLSGRHHIAGEWGHNMLPASVLMLLPESERNRECYCGRKDCIETYLSGPGISKSYALRFNSAKNSVELIDAMRQGDLNAVSIWSSYIEQLAAALAQVANIIDPDLIVVGGGMSLIEELYPALTRVIHKHVFTEEFTTPIVPAKLGDSAGVYGAAWLVSDSLAE